MIIDTTRTETEKRMWERDFENNMSILSDIFGLTPVPNVTEDLIREDLIREDLIRHGFWLKDRK